MFNIKLVSVSISLPGSRQLLGYPLNCLGELICHKAFDIFLIHFGIRGLFSLLTLRLPCLWLHPASVSSHSPNVHLTREDQCAFASCQYVAHGLPRVHAHCWSAAPKPRQEH